MNGFILVIVDILVVFVHLSHIICTGEYNVLYFHSCNICMPSPIGRRTDSLITTFLLYNSLNARSCCVFSVDQCITMEENVSDVAINATTTDFIVSVTFYLLSVLMLLVAIMCTVPFTLALDQRRVMGFNTYNAFDTYDRMLLLRTARFLKERGLLSSGYDYFIIDGRWWEGVDTGIAVRNATGHMTTNDIRFPGGMGALFSDISSMGFKPGVYMSVSKDMCNRDANGGMGYEKQDVDLFVEWGSRFIKLDNCDHHGNDKRKAIDIMTKYRTLIPTTVLVSNSLVGCTDSSWKPWCERYCDMWRLSEDNLAHFDSIKTSVRLLRKKRSNTRGHNDPDVLSIGDIPLNEARFQLFVFAITNSPLIISAPCLDDREIGLLSNTLLLDAYHADGVYGYIGRDMWTKASRITSSVYLVVANERERELVYNIHLVKIGMTWPCLVTDVVSARSFVVYHEMYTLVVKGRDALMHILKPLHMTYTVIDHKNSGGRYTAI